MLFKIRKVIVIFYLLCHIYIIIQTQKKYAEKYKLFMKQYDDIKIDYMWYFYEIMKKKLQHT